ncbi:basic proline-rich protein-like [Tachyglossus aculeatus]|uniref:basic proline-rich protein-like n=1 Tax=Tachyglossus aculeatus TaxID=9261 RepID=UPI0018F7C664|nr:basic proline-rich protein-like [Tachyglossus aculeatus]
MGPAPSAARLRQSLTRTGGGSPPAPRGPAPQERGCAMASHKQEEALAGGNKARRGLLGPRAEGRRGSGPPPSVRPSIRPSVRLCVRQPCPQTPGPLPGDPAGQYLSSRPVDGARGRRLFACLSCRTMLPSVPRTPTLPSSVSSCSSVPKDRKRPPPGHGPQGGQKRRLLSRDLEDPASPPDPDPQDPDPHGESQDLLDFVNRFAQSLAEDEHWTGPASPGCSSPAVGEREGPPWSGAAHEELERVICQLRAKGPASCDLPDDLLDYLNGDTEPPRPATPAPPASHGSSSPAAGEREGPPGSGAALKELERVIRQLRARGPASWVLPDDVLDYLNGDPDPPSPATPAPLASPPSNLLLNPGDHPLRTPSGLPLGPEIPKEESRPGEPATSLSQSRRNPEYSLCSWRSLESRAEMVPFGNLGIPNQAQDGSGKTSNGSEEVAPPHRLLPPPSF